MPQTGQQHHTRTASAGLVPVSVSVSATDGRAVDEKTLPMNLTITCVSFQ